MTTFSFSQRSKPDNRRQLSKSLIGFACPMCDERTDVKDSRQNEDGLVRRRRKCIQCDNTFYTVEHCEDKVPNKSEKERAKLIEKILPKLFNLSDLIDELRAEHE
jgi:hypothetical protein